LRARNGKRMAMRQRSPAVAWRCHFNDGILGCMRAGPEGDICKWRENGFVPLICPTCQNVFAASDGHGGDPRLLCMGLFSMF
jgi:hypothetical protein